MRFRGLQELLRSLFSELATVPATNEGLHTPEYMKVTEEHSQIVRDTGIYDQDEINAQYNVRNLKHTNLKWYKKVIVVGAGPSLTRKFVDSIRLEDYDAVLLTPPIFKHFEFLLGPEVYVVDAEIDKFMVPHYYPEDLSKINLVDGGPSPESNGLGQIDKKSGVECLDYEMLSTRLKALNDTEYFIKQLDLENLQGDLFMPFKEITSIKKRILFILNDSKEYLDPVALSDIARQDVPLIKKLRAEKIKPTLSLLISSQKDLHLGAETSADIYFQLPNSLKNECAELIDLFLNNQRLIPWFPSVLIGEDYRAALEFLQVEQPELIVTDNTGIAHEAYQRGISWIAGPYLNIVNSYSLACLKENFNCYGSFISNELKKIQIRSIKKPENFKLYYSIYHPILLLTSRQCLFHQVTGCEKNTIDDTCIQRCEKSSSITNSNKASLFITKAKGNYHSIYNETNFLNTDIVKDVVDHFASFFIDLRDIKTDTKIKFDKSRTVNLFENHLNGIPNATEELRHSIYPSTNSQYIKGI